VIAEEEWRRTESLRPNGSLDEFIIMPNHLHRPIGRRRDVLQNVSTTPRFGCASENDVHHITTRRKPRRDHPPV
jgi:hypothetical protein